MNVTSKIAEGNEGELNAPTWSLPCDRTVSLGMAGGCPQSGLNRLLGNPHLSNSPLPLVNPDIDGENDYMLQQSFEITTSNAVLMCDQCSYQTKLKHLYLRHVNKHSLDRPFLCPDCGLSDYDHTSFVDHMMDHQQTKILNCCFCKYRTNIFGMRLHIAKHRAVQPYDCSLCEFSSNHPGSLKSHVFVFHTKKFSCSYCEQVMTKYSLMEHTEEIHGVSLESSQVKPFFAVKARGMIESNTVEVEPGKLGTISTNDLLPLKLPFPKVFLKRIDPDAIDDTAENANSMQSNSECTSNHSPKVPKLTIKMIKSEPVISNSTLSISQTALQVTDIGNPPDMDETVEQMVMSEPEEIDIKPDVESLAASMKPRKRKTNFHCYHCSFTTNKKSLLRLHAPKHLLDSRLVCSECDFKEISHYIFAKHLASRRTNQGKVIYCCFCDYTNKSISNMAQHLEKHKPVSLNDCHKCGMSFATRSSLGEHYRNMHAHKVECPECGKYKTKHAMKNHRKRHLVEKKDKAEINVVTEILALPDYRVSSKPYLKCSSCSYSTRMKSLLRRHVAKHLMPEAFWVCAKCDFTDSSGYRFASHLKCHSEEDAFECCFCDYSSIVVHNLARHLEVHRSVHFFDCSKCEKSFAQYPTLRKHHIEKHVEKHQCADCKMVMSLSRLQHHSKVHHGRVDIPPRAVSTATRKYSHLGGLGETLLGLHKCDFCNYSTDIESLAAKHVVKHTMPEAYFECPICQYKESHNLTFAKHLTYRCYNSPSCCFCEYTSTSEHNLSNHLEIHRPIHFHDCPMCDKSYSANATLYKHIKTYHVDEHTCTECGEIVTYYVLLEHKKLHGSSLTLPVQIEWTPQLQEIDPSLFHCYHCTYSTKKKSLLRRHAVKHLVDSRLVCPDCDFKENNPREFAKHCVSCQGGFNCCFCSFSSTELTYVASHVELHRPVRLHDCTECRHSCHTKSYLRAHYQNMHLAEHKCPQCDKVMSRFELRRHRLKHTMPSLNVKADAESTLSVSVCEPGSFLCGVCDYSTEIKSLLDKHVAKHQTNSDLICPDCNFAESNTNEFARHLRTHSENKTIFNCCFCKFSTIHSGNLPSHLDSHKSVHFFDCPKCDKSYSCKNNLKLHYEKFHVEQHVCPTCNAVTTKDKLQMHKEMHANQENPTFNCDDCTYKTKKKSLIRKHVSKHLENCFVCPECKFRGSEADAFVEHLYLHSSDGTLKCCFCSYFTYDARSLAMHLEAHQVRFYDCPKCEKSFERSEKLTEHIRQHHKDKHRCSVCGKIMTYYRLIRHMKLHQESDNESHLSARFRCNHCAFSTRKKCLLRRHAPKHLVDNRLSCSICKYRANKSWKFVAHLMRHSDDEIINCCFCDYSTTNKHNLAGHVDLHRPVHLYDCSKCDRSFIGGSGLHSLQTHFHKMHIQKHTCQRNIRPLVKCSKRMTLFQLRKHHARKHKALPEELPYYVCRGPKTALAPKTEPVPVNTGASTSITVEVQPDIQQFL